MAFSSSAETQTLSSRRWPWWLAGALLLLTGGLLIAFALDPWLRRQLEQAVSTQTHGAYRLRVGGLTTRLVAGSVTLRDVRLRPARAITAADSLPILALDLPVFQLTGIDLWALVRKREQHLNKLIISGLRLRLDSLPAAPAHPLPGHQRLPARVPGLTLNQLTVRDARLTYGPRPALVAPAPGARQRPARAAVQRLDLTARDFALNAAGAADTTRLFYARAWQTHLRGATARLDHHRVNVHRFAFDTRAGWLTLDSLRLQPTRVGPPGPAYLTMRVGRARLTGLRAAGLMRHRFRADSLRIAGLLFYLKAPTTPPPLIHELVRPFFTQFELNDGLLTDGLVRIRSVSRVPVIQQLRLHAEGLKLDSAAWADPARTYYAQRWALQTGASHLLVDVPFYRVAWDRVWADSRGGLFDVNGLHVAPTMDLTQLSRRKGHEVSHITADAPRLRATGFDFSALLHRRGLVVNTLALPNLRLHLRSDGRYPINPQESVITPERLGKLKFRVDLRRLIVTNAALDFWYISPASDKAAVSRITALSGTLTNATNDPARMSAAHPMTAQATALLQGTCRVRATGTFNVLDPRGRHQLRGTFGPAPLRIVNPAIEPVALVSIKTGTVQRIAVTMIGDRDGIRGEMRGAYQNLHIRLLNKKVEKTLLTASVSKVANKLIIHDDNSDKPGKPLRVGRIQSKRERRFSVFGLWKQGLVSGVLNTIGLGEDKATKMSEKKTEPGE